jgi:hypothetical protein
MSVFTKTRRPNASFGDLAPGSPGSGQAETVFSMIKRNLTDSLAGRDRVAQNLKMVLTALIRNLMILLCLVIELVYK